MAVDALERTFATQSSSSDSCSLFSLSFNKECVKLGTAETGVRINTSFSKPQKSPTALHGELSGHMFVTLLAYCAGKISL